MKKSSLIIVAMVMVLVAQSRFLSPIPLPKTTIVDLDPTPYDASMLHEALDEGQIFTFLAKSAETEDPELVANRNRFASLFNILERETTGKVYRVAMLMDPDKIGKYATSTSETTLVYLMHRKRPFDLELITYRSDVNDSLQNAVENVVDGRYDLIVAPVTRVDAQYLCTQNLPTRLYIPTLHAKRVVCDNPNVMFGGIDYEEEVRSLSDLVESNASTVVVSDRSSVSTFLNTLVSRYIDVNDSIVLDGGSYYKDIIERHDDLNQSTLFLNTSLLKSSLFLSQLTLADMHPQIILSTQINYSPLLLTLTQFHDRENMVVASEIGGMDPFIQEKEALVGGDIRFHWLNYTTLVGLDYFDAIARGVARVTHAMPEGRNFRYEIHHYDAGLYRFVPRKIPVFNEKSIQPMDDEETPSEAFEDPGSSSISHSEMSE